MAAENTGEMNNSRTSDQTNNLEGFITNQIRQQERESRENDNLDVQKRDDFIARALAESSRMNKEIEKSQEKRDRLHTEFGTRMDEWRNEHASEVLTPQQQELIRQQHQ